MPVPLAPRLPRADRPITRDLPAGLAAAMLFLPFVTPPGATMPTGLATEWLAMAIGLAAACAALHAGELRRLALPAAWLLMLVPLLALQVLLQPSPYPQYAWLGSACLAHAALMLQLGQVLAMGPQSGARTDILATALLSAALLNAATGVLQAGIPHAWRPDWLPALAGNRAYGLIQYINPYASFLVTGAVALAWLWSCRRIPAAVAAMLALLLGAGTALSGSRSVFLYLVWMVLAGLAILAGTSGHPGRRAFARALLRTAACLAIAQLVPLGLEGISSGQTSAPGTIVAGTLARIGQQPVGMEPRLALWQLALDMFAGAPLAGVGLGRFAENAFRIGLPDPLRGNIWTSSHNLLLDLLAETGIAGTLPVLACLTLILRGTARRLAIDDGPAWFAATAAGIGLLHAMLELPLRLAHFLGLTVLLLGLCSAPPIAVRPGRSVTRLPVLAATIFLGLSLAISLRDWQWLDRLRREGTWRNYTAQSAATRSDLLTLARGPLGPEAERWMLLGSPPTSADLAEKLALGDRVIRHWPGSDTLTRHAIHLSLAGRHEEAVRLLRRTLAAFPGRSGLIRSLLQQAALNEPDAIGPLLYAQNAWSARSAGHAPDDAVRSAP